MPTQFERRTMARFYLVISSLTVLLPTICNAEGPDPECEDGVVIGANATAFLEFINGYRRKLIEGTQNNGKNQELLPKPLNVKEVEWDCALEEFIQFDVDWNLCDRLATYEPWDYVTGNYSCVYKGLLARNQSAPLLGSSLQSLDLETICEIQQEGHRMYKNYPCSIGKTRRIDQDVADYCIWDNVNPQFIGIIAWDELLAPSLKMIDEIDKTAFDIEYGRVAIKDETFEDVRVYAEWVRADVTKVACALARCSIPPAQYAMICCNNQKSIENGSDYTIYETFKTTSTATTPATTTATIAATAIASAAPTTKNITTAAKIPTGTPCPTTLPTSTPCPTAPTTPCPTYPPARAKREAKAVNADAYSKKGKFPEATPGENTICPSNKGMTDSLRTLFLDMHNYRRAKLALGKVTGSDRKRMLPAKNMLKLNYACELEASALHYAAHCPSTRSKANVRPNQGENFLRLAKVGFSSFADAVNITVYDWWDVVNDTPVIDNTEKLQIRRFRSPIITFTQMAWATTRYLGCAIADCNSYYVSICRYSPKGNAIGEMLYKPGHTCSECNLDTICEEELGLCI